MEDKCINVFKNSCEDVRAQVFTALWIRFLMETERREPAEQTPPFRKI